MGDASLAASMSGKRSARGSALRRRASDGPMTDRTGCSPVGSRHLPVGGGLESLGKDLCKWRKGGFHASGMKIRVLMEYRKHGILSAGRSRK